MLHRNGNLGISFSSDRIIVRRDKNQWLNWIKVVVCIKCAPRDSILDTSIEPKYQSPDKSEKSIHSNYERLVDISAISRNSVNIDRLTNCSAKSAGKFLFGSFWWMTRRNNNELWKGDTRLWRVSILFELRVNFFLQAKLCHYTRNIPCIVLVLF